MMLKNSHDQELRDLKINLIFGLGEVHWAENFSLSGKNNFLKESTFSLQKIKRGEKKERALSN